MGPPDGGYGGGDAGSGAFVALNGGGDGAGGAPGLRHRALVARSRAEHDEVVDAFVAGGVAAGDAVLAVVDRPVADRLRRELRAPAEDLTFVDVGDFYSEAAWTLARFRHEVETRTAGGRTLRVLAEPTWWNRPAVEHEAWLSMEAVGNAAFAGAPMEVLCAYDGAAVPQAALEGVWHTHPEVVVDGDVRPNAAYTDPALYCTRHRDRPLPPLPPRVEDHPFNGATLAGLRRTVGAWATGAGLTPDRGREVVLAVHEVASNSVRHGGGEGVLRLTATPDELLAEVQDAGVITSPFAGLLPPAGAAGGGYGLWLVHQLVELVQLRSGPNGSVVRLHVRRRPSNEAVEGG